MTGASAAIEAKADDTVESTTLEGEVESAHTLVLGARTFQCASELPFGTLMKYASAEFSSLELWHHILVKAVKLEDQLVPGPNGDPIVVPGSMDEVWDACDDVGQEASLAAIKDMMASYSAPHPTQPASPS